MRGHHTASSKPKSTGLRLVGVAAQVPLAPHPRRVPGIGQRLGGRHLPARHPVRAARDRHRLRARADGMTTGQQRRTARRALRLDVEVQELQALGGEPVDPRCGRAAQHPAAVAAELTPAEVVPVEEHDVRLLRRSCLTPHSRSPSVRVTAESRSGHHPRLAHGSRLPRLSRTTAAAASPLVDEPPRGGEGRPTTARLPMDPTCTRWAGIGEQLVLDGLMPALDLAGLVGDRGWSGGGRCRSSGRSDRTAPHPSPFRTGR